MDEQSLNELLECSVCLERLDHSSKVLPCQHTFCRRCLEEIISTKRELRCPECRTLVEVRVDDLPPNILLVRLLEGIKTRQTVDGSRSGRRNEVGSSSNGNRSRQGTQACAKALYCYEAKDHGDLSFKKGDIITLRKQVDENWYHGELNGQHGFFPASYVQDEVLTVIKGDEVLTVIKRVDDNWVEGKKGEKIGIFPISFVEMNEPAKIIINSKLNTPPTQHAGLSSDVTADKGSGDRSQTPPTSHLLGAGLASQMPQQKRHSFTASSHKSNQASQYHRRSLELSSSGNLVIASSSSSSSSGVTRIPPPPVPVVSSRTESQTVMSKSESTKGQTTNESVSGAMNNEAVAGTSSKVSDAGKPALGGGGGVTAPVYVALYNYKPAKDDEVELRKGDYYSVSNKCQDGWFKGQCLKTGVIGVFPGNYVQLASEFIDAVCSDTGCPSDRRSNSAFRPVSGNTSSTKNKPHFSSAVPNSSSAVVPNSETSSLPLMTSSSGAVTQLSQSSVTDKHSARRRSLSPSVPSNTSPSRPSKSPAGRSSMSPHRSSSSVSQKAPPINPRGAKIMATSTSSTSSASYAAMSSSAFSKLTTNHSSAAQSATGRDISSGSRPLPSVASGGATVYVPPPHSSSHKSGNSTNLNTTAQGQYFEAGFQV
ncbi:hypothetical protein KUTeg_024006 [Tegillarca granosa]|uniref:Uncharacterized protein n=1 Tax=Tegillarca granosa TaxID=220873 RepID=A0ABQ9E1W1_TEGGR|nr:hypothetical protein KUTeg_024006 [Tegillarca granosa]